MKYKDLAISNTNTKNNMYALETTQLSETSTNKLFTYVLVNYYIYPYPIYMVVPKVRAGAEI